MKIKITTKNIIITPAPKRNKKKGLKIWFWSYDKPVDRDCPIATTDIIKGQRKYNFPGKEFRCSIKSIEF